MKICSSLRLSSDNFTGSNFRYITLKTLPYVLIVHLSVFSYQTKGIFYYQVPAYLFTN